MHTDSLIHNPLGIPPIQIGRDPLWWCPSLPLFFPPSSGNRNPASVVNGVKRVKKSKRDPCGSCFSPSRLGSPFPLVLQQSSCSQCCSGLRAVSDFFVVGVGTFCRHLLEANLQVRFWGTRGSIAMPGPSTARYGGNTPCIEARSARGTVIIVDCGTGGHLLGQNLMSVGAEGLRGHILISHTHWDHIQGIPFFAPLFVPGNEWDIYGPKGLGQSLREVLAGQMQYSYFPFTLDQCGAKIRYHDLVEGTFDIDDIKVSTHYLNHPALTFGYRLEADGVAVVYACDHEPHSRMLATGRGEITGQDLRHAEFVNCADLLIHDAQFTAEEYPAKIGWGHSTVEYVAKLSQYAEVKRVALTHHDPLRDDDAIDHLLAGIRARLRENASSLDVFAAAEGQVVEVSPSHHKGPAYCAGEFQAQTSIEPALAESSVLLGMVDTKMAAALSKVIRAEGIHVECFSDLGEARRLIAKRRPSLMILEHDPPRIDGMETCRAIRQQDNGRPHHLPVVMVASQEDQATAAAAGVTDWLIKPFTGAYARSKISAWVLRTACEWMRGSRPEDEERRLARAPVQVQYRRRADAGASGSRPIPKGTENRRSSENVISTDKSALLWMYCREIAPFETPTFGNKVGELIVRATSAPH
jgi:phosphoribosyl 1,2-cyclic phosphodiesterase/CheY-like chemotaxis protein